MYRIILSSSQVSMPPENCYSPKDSSALHSIPRCTISFLGVELSLWTLWTLYPYTVIRGILSALE